MSIIRNRFKKAYKNLVRYLNHINSPIIRWYYKHFWTPGEKSIARLFDQFSKDHEVSFIQIGANDGMERDPMLKFIRRDGWTGVLIEPQKKVFEQLQYLHANSKGVTLLNAAVSNTDEVKKLYKISFSDSRWASGLSTFQKESLEKQIEIGYVEDCARAEGISLPENKSDYITTEDVNCISFESVLSKYRIQHINLLQIDTEGFDFEIIKMVNFKKLKPELISFEIAHLSETDRRSCFDLLHQEGYQIYPRGRDALAYQPNTVKPITEN